MQYIIVTRTQRARGSGGRGHFGGPDRYAALLAVPEGVEVPAALRADILEKRGVEVIDRGEYYSRSGGKRGLNAQVMARLEAQKAALEAEKVS